MTFADLRALHAIIGAAIDDIERIYRPPSSLRRASLSSMTPALNPSSSLSSFRSSSKARSSISTDSDIEEEDDLDADDVPLTPLSASNARFQPSPSQGSANSVRFASGKKSRERSHTMSSLPQSNASSVSSVPPMPPPILKQPPLDFPDLDVPIAVVSTSPPDAPSRAAPSTPSSSPQISISPSVTVELENVGAGASTLLDPSLRQREWRKKCEDLTAHPDVIKATNRIVSACGQISAMVQKPFLTVCDAAMGYNLPACLRFLEAAHIVEMLREAGPRGLHSSEIAKKIEIDLWNAGYNDADVNIAGTTAKGGVKSIDPNKLSHILRLLATHHITREVRPDVFANNRVSSVIDSGKSWKELVEMEDSKERKYDGTDGIAAFVGLCTDELFKASAYLADCYLFPPQSPIHSAPSSPKATGPSHASGWPNTPAAATTPPNAIPPVPRLTVSAPAAHLGIVTPNESTSSFDSLLEDEDPVPVREPGDSPMTFANNPHPTPQKATSRARTRTRSSGWGFNTLPQIPGSPPTPQSNASAARPSILKRLSSRSFSRNSMSSTHSNPSSIPPVPSLPPTPTTPRSATFDAPETPRSRVSSTHSVMRESPDTPKSPLVPTQGQTFSALLSTPKSTPRRRQPSHPAQGASAQAPTEHQTIVPGEMLKTPRSTPNRDSIASESNVMRTPRWTPSKESLRAIAKKGSFASLRSGVSGGRKLSTADIGPPMPHTGEPQGADDSAAGGLLGPAFDLRPPGLAGEPRARTFPGAVAVERLEQPLPPLPVAVVSPPPIPLKSALRSHSAGNVPLAKPVDPHVARRSAEHAERETVRKPRRVMRGLRPGDEMYAPFNVAFDTRLRYFEWLERKENVFRLKRFGKAMTGTEKWEVPGSIIGGFPWHKLPDGSVVVDVGGGIGSTSMLLANAFPHLRFVIQDRPPVVEMGTAAWRTRNPELLDTGRATFQAHDFFRPQPELPAHLAGKGAEESESEVEAEGDLGRKVQGEDVAQGADREVKPAVFLMRVITHDWPDSYVTRILLRLRQAAGPNTRLLLADYVLPLACVDEDEDIEPETPEDSEESGRKITRDPLPGTVRTLAPEGSPLLPNLGKANANAYWLDLTMRVMFNAQERTLRELAALTLTAGWKIVQVTRTEGALFGHLIAVPVDIPPETLALPLFDEAESELESSAHDDGTALDMLTPPMGDTFLSSVDLPSEAAIRAGVATGAGKRSAARSQSADGKRRRRARAYTFAGAKDGKEREGKGGGGGGGEVRRGFRTILKMLSKAHLANGAGSGGGAGGEREEEGVQQLQQPGPAVPGGGATLARQRTRT